jgi:hypothetical protein
VIRSGGVNLDVLARILVSPRIPQLCPSRIGEERRYVSVKSISTEDLRERLASGTAAVFDVRGDVEFECGHIPGAKTARLGCASPELVLRENAGGFRGEDAKR